MLTAPTDIKKFFLEHGPKIFPQSRWHLLREVDKVRKAMWGPRYDGKYLYEVVREKLGDLRLGQAVTNVVIPTLNIKTGQPTVFSTYKVDSKPGLNAKVSDICLGTSAAPTYLPAYCFENDDPAVPKRKRKFDLVDGGMVANNPVNTQIVMEEIARAYSSGKPMSYDNFLVISLGTGTPEEQKYETREASKWGVAGWLRSGEFKLGGDHFVDFHLANIFPADNCNYLRIQDDTLSGTIASLDVATEENMKNLVEVGEELLTKPVSRMNIDTGVIEVVPCVGTNAEALKALAKKLSKEKDNRIAQNI